MFFMTDVTRILSAIDQGDPSASDQLLPLVYDELRKLAKQRLAAEKPGHTLQATALVHDAYIRLVDSNGSRHWNGRGHFFAAAAEAMRRILIEQARRKRSLKRGGDQNRVAFDEATIANSESDPEVLALDDALQRFQQVDPTAAELVKLRYFAGLTIPQAAEALGISPSTADRYWAYARSWLHADIKKEDR